MSQRHSLDKPSLRSWHSPCAMIRHMVLGMTSLTSCMSTVPPETPLLAAPVMCVCVCVYVCVCVCVCVSTHRLPAGLVGFALHAASRALFRRIRIRLHTVFGLYVPHAGVPGAPSAIGLLGPAVRKSLKRELAQRQRRPRM